MTVPDIIVAALAGGPGTRLWPLSRGQRPKFLLELVPGRPSTLVDTVRRSAAVAGPDQVWVVCGAEHVAGILDAVPGLTADQLIAEPTSRDSLAALALVAHRAAASSPATVLVTVPGDNYADDIEAFVAAVREAAAIARAGGMCTIGLRPTFASVSHGYIEVGDDGGVVSFIEKPDLPVAERYVAGGRHLWNAGIYVARAGAFVDAVRRHHPEVMRAVEALASGDEEPWRALGRVSIDHGIAEAEALAGRMSVVAADIAWSDVGDISGLEDDLASETVRIDSAGSVVRSSGDRLVAVVGLPGVVVIDTPDAVLVTTAAEAPRIRAVVEELRKRGRHDLL